ncbi:MAG: ATP-binding protein [Elusimicrobiota bacterium]
MFERHFSDLLFKKLKRFPVVTILGPRQCGKTTFIRNVLPKWSYLDMEKPSDFVPFSQDPEARINQLDSHVILDEAQRLPELFPILRSVIDGSRTKKGRFVLLGSASPTLVRHISESLAGRTTFLDLTPFRWDEITGKSHNLELNTLWYRGGFPHPFLEKNNAGRVDWFESYTRTFIERDLTSLGLDVSAVQMRKLWTMLAHFNGAIWNASNLAASMGTSYHTVNRYTDILEQTFLIRKLLPYFFNLGKRIIKSPKVYFRDTGLLHYFLGIRDLKTLDNHPSRGASWEAFLVEHVISGFQLAEPGTQAYYWRTASGVEVDLLIERGNRIIPFEIKLHSSPTRNDVRGLVTCMKDLKLKKGYVLYPGANNYSLGEGITALSADKVLCDLKQLTVL